MANFRTFSFNFEGFTEEMTKILVSHLLDGFQIRLQLSYRVIAGSIR